MKTLAVVAMEWLMLLDSAGGVEQECGPAPGQWVRVNSEWEPDATAARATARARLDEAVRAWLQTEQQPARIWQRRKIFRSCCPVPMCSGTSERWIANGLTGP